MKLKIFVFSLIFVLLTATAPTISATENNQTNDWNSLRNYLNSEVAVKSTNQRTVFGILQDISDGELKLQVADKKGEVLFKREEVKKIWLARRTGGRNTLKGAGIGAAIGAGIGLGGALSTLSNPEEDGTAGALVPLLAIYGAGIGGVIGFFIHQKHKKERLIYQN